MQKKLLIAASGFLTTFLLLKIYTDSLPAYGIKRGWKKILLNTAVTEEVQKISIPDAAANKKTALFLDTRAKEEYEVSHIEGARFVGYNEFHLDFLKDIPKEQPIILYCSIGKRSGDIGKKVIDAGYTNVQNLYGGIFEWINNGYPVVDTENKPTDKVHAYDKLWGKWLNRGEKVY